MIRIFYLYLFLLLVSCSSTEKIEAQQPIPLFDPTDTSEVTNTQPTSLTKITFGSCNRHDDPQPLWKDIINNQPDVWVWLGDIVYGDTKDMSILKQKYDAQKTNKAYQTLLNSKTKIMGIWDDHDYGSNNAGKEYTQKAASRDLLFDFLDMPENADTRKREGAYNSHTFGEANQQVKIILLDARYFRDKPSQNGKVLGEEQWEWLSKELYRSKAAINIIGCGIQMIPEEHRFEKWANFPKERTRLFDLLVRSKAKGIVLISGDRHIAEISSIEWEGATAPFYEITSSGLTHFYRSFSGEANKHRLGEVVADFNFGMIEINWDSQPLEVKLQIRSTNNQLKEEVLATF